MFGILRDRSFLMPDYKSDLYAGSMKDQELPQPDLSRTQPSRRCRCMGCSRWCSKDVGDAAEGDSRDEHCPR